MEALYASDYAIFGNLTLKKLYLPYLQKTHFSNFYSKSDTFLFDFLKEKMETIKFCWGKISLLKNVYVQE